MPLGSAEFLPPGCTQLLCPLLRLRDVMRSSYLQNFIAPAKGTLSAAHSVTHLERSIKKFCSDLSGEENLTSSFSNFFTLIIRED